MVGCYYHAHRPQDGQWLPADSMPKTATGRPIAYVANGAHGLYTGVSLPTGMFTVMSLVLVCLGKHSSDFKGSHDSQVPVLQ